MINFSTFSRKILNLGEQEAIALGHMIVASEHILIAISRMENTLASKILETYGLVTENIIDNIENLYIKVKSADDKIVYSQQVKDLFSSGLIISRRLGFSYIGYEHFIIAMLNQEGSIAQRILSDYGLNVEEVTTIVVRNKNIYEEDSTDIATNDNIEGVITSVVENKKKEILEQNKDSISPLEKNTLHLKKYAEDLTELAENGKIEEVIDVDSEIERILQILIRKTKNSPILVGEPGVGKSAIVGELARRTANKDMPEIFGDRRIISLDVSSLLSGAKYKGDLEERLYNILDDIKNNPSFLIFIDNFHMISVIGLQESTVQASHIIKKALVDGSLQVIGACSIADYDKYIAKDFSLRRRVKEVIIEEADDEKAIKILKTVKKRFEKFHNVTITDEACERAVELSRKYIKNKFLPDKAIDIIDDASARKRLEYGKIGIIENIEIPALEIKSSDIEKIISKMAKIPLEKLTEDESKKLINLPIILSEEVVGQKDAIDAISKAIQRARVGLKDANKPIGSFIFLGPTGVGKTQLCKSLAKILFDDEESFIRVDMSEYQEKHTVSKFIGSPPGYTGYNEGGQLTEKVKKRPYSVVLFDEIEKAHFDVYDILLQVLDDGHLTDSKGERVSFKNTIIIMTSNVGQTTIKKDMNLGFSANEETYRKLNTEKRKKHYLSELEKNFRPEFLNRIDEIVVFNSLTRDNLNEIVKIMISRLQERLEERDIKIDIESSAVNLILKEGYSEEYGARPLNRAIQKMITDQLTIKILKKEIKNKDKIKIAAENEKISFDIDTREEI